MEICILVKWLNHVLAKRTPVYTYARTLQSGPAFLRVEFQLKYINFILHYSGDNTKQHMAFHTTYYARVNGAHY